MIKLTDEIGNIIFNAVVGVKKEMGEDGTLHAAMSFMVLHLMVVLMVTGLSMTKIMRLVELANKAATSKEVKSLITKIIRKAHDQPRDEQKFVH